MQAVVYLKLMHNKIYTRQLPLHRQSKGNLSSPSRRRGCAFRLEQRFADSRFRSITIDQLSYMLVDPSSTSNG